MYSKLYCLYISVDTDNISPSGFITIRCPFSEKHKHGDNNASAGFNDKTGVYNCHVCGVLSPVDFITKIAGVDKAEAYKIIDNFRRGEGLISHIDISISCPPVSSVRFDDLFNQSQNYFDSKEPIVVEYMESRGLHLDTLQQYKIGLLPAHLTSWGKQSLVFPYTLSGKVVGIKYRDSSANKCWEEGSYPTLWGIDNLEGITDTVVLVEGESDCLIASQVLSPLGITVIGAPSAVFNSDWVREFEDVRQLIIVPHSDEAAIKMVNKANEVMSGDVTITELPWSKRQYGKDICDWIRINSEEAFADLVRASISNNISRIITSQELLDTPDNKEWLIQGLLGSRQACIIIGNPKSYKTWLVLNLIRCLLIPGSYFCDMPDFVSVAEGINILFIEEEGNRNELKERASESLKGTDWTSHIFWGHKLGIRLDDYNNIKKLERMIAKYNIDVVVLDPLQKLHALDENDAGQMGKVWLAISSLMIKFPKLSVIILHHSRKGGQISEKWEQIRGSSRTAAEADVGIFIAKRPRAEAAGAIVTFDGRSIPAVTAPDGGEEFKLFFDNGILSLDTSQVFISKHESLDYEMRDRLVWLLKDAAKHYGTSISTIKRWVDKVPHLSVTHPTRGTPARIVYNKEVVDT